MTVIYQTTITRIGASATMALEEQMLITFREGAPADIEEYCFIHNHGEFSGALAPGERLCLFSDGITECENRSGEQFGEARLQAWLQDSVTQPLPALLPRFARHLIRWRSGDAQETQAMADDVSLLIIERTGDSDEN